MLTVDSRAADELSLYERPEIWLNKLINRDGLYKDLASKLDLESTGKISCSGTREIDYPPMRFHGGGELEVAKSFSLPPDLVDKFAGMQKNCLMGIFSLCERAWITIDNELFMWNYEDGEDLAYYDGVNDTIICVGLANPRSGLLPNKVQHLLCVVTPLEIFVLGMTYVTSGERSRENSANTILQVMPDPLYCLPTDNFTVSCMEATENGRIFFGTQEGSLLELNCSPIPGWSHDSVESVPNGRTGPCALINHSASTLSMLLPTVITSGFRSVDPICQLSCDTVRHLLYVRTENSSLSVYEYAGKSDSGPMRNGVSGSLTRLASLSGSDLAHAAATAVRSIDRDQFRSLVSIVPLSSGLCYLMAVTKIGIRLYFGDHLRLIHIRLPPISPYGRMGLGEVKLTAETRGTVVFVSALPSDISSPNALTGSMSLDSRTPFIGQPKLTFGQAGRSEEDSFNQTNGATHGQFDVPPHVLYTLSPDPYPWTANLTEVSSAAWCVDGAWALVVLPDDCDHICAEMDSVNRTTMMSTDKTKDGSNPSCLSHGQPPVVLTQHLDPPYRRLLLISAQGLIHLRLPNPLTRLKEFLMREASSSALNTSLSATGLIDQYTGNPTRLGTQSSLAYPSLVDLDDSVTDFALNTRFLSAYLHQFSPDEAICAALVIGAASFVDGRGIHAYVEQAVLYFAAEASQFWIPAVRRANPGLQQGQRQQALSIDRSLSSGLFLFSGISVFFARLARTFWRSPLFRDASRVSTKGSASSELASSGRFRSWMHTFVHVLASASPLRAGRTQQEAKQLIISRLDPDEICWLVHQVSFLQQFLRRQLNVRGGWLRASTTGLTPRSGPIVSRSHTTDDGDEYVDVVLLQRLAEELDKLLSAVLEVLGFWQIFSEHVVHKVVERLPGDQRALLLQLPFEVYVISLLDALFPTGLQSPPGLTVPGPPMQLLHHGPVLAGNLGATELITALINALIDYYLAEASQAVDSGVSLDAITSRLQCACPTLFANEDAMCAKASECLIQVNLLRAGMTSSDMNGVLDSSSVEQQPVSQSSAEIEQLVLHALQLYAEAGPGLDLDGATERLIASGAWSGAVALCLSVAKQRDPTDVAVDCLKNGRRPSTEPLVSDVKSDRWGRKPVFAQSELAATEGR
ncbi:hypothetical protein PHET_07691 [Paragonimus heterotremus]|uniref:Nucleoporin Nup133/Nup155-like N-terminal domain-containing protein n=1 Tax=Paragonimus heterotremus TaxID=100268 RepID=A0A8J4SXM9_9TREM|nr:hypothetical protein PHET_07691 [Paragonimus heterotremus]